MRTVSHNRPRAGGAGSDLSVKPKKVLTLGGDCENLRWLSLRSPGGYQPLTQGLERSSPT